MLQSIRMAASDGCPLDVLIYGEKGGVDVICANAIATTSKTLSLLADRFSAAGRFITWEGRGLPGPREGAYEKWGPEVYAQDLIDILDHLAVPAAHIIGVCSGAAVAFIVAEKFPERIKSITSFMGHFPTLGRETASTGAMDELLHKVVSQPSMAQLALKAFSTNTDKAQQISQLAEQHPAIQADKFVEALAMTKNMTQSIEDIKCLAAMWVNFQHHELGSSLERFERSALFINGTNEAVTAACSEQTVAASNIVKNARVILREDITHYSHCYDSELVEEVFDFIVANESLPSPAVLHGG